MHETGRPVIAEARIRPLRSSDFTPVIAVIDEWWGGRPAVLNRRAIAELGTADDAERMALMFCHRAGAPAGVEAPRREAAVRAYPQHLLDDS